MIYEMHLVWSVLEDGVPQVPVKGARQVYDYALKTCYKPNQMGQEIAYLLFVNRAGIIYGQLELCKGGTDQVVFDKKIVLKSAIDSMAHSVIIVHNHPTGNCLPSHADIEQTNVIRRALSAIDVPLLDHVVIGDNEFYSFAEERKWES